MGTFPGSTKIFGAEFFRRQGPTSTAHAAQRPPPTVNGRILVLSLTQHRWYAHLSTSCLSRATGSITSSSTTSSSTTGTRTARAPSCSSVTGRLRSLLPHLRDVFLQRVHRKLKCTGNRINGGCRMSRRPTLPTAHAPPAWGSWATGADRQWLQCRSGLSSPSPARAPRPRVGDGVGNGNTTSHAAPLLESHVPA